MSEDFLNSLPINDLVDLMAKSVDELMAMNKFSHNKIELESKQKEVEAIQKILIAKRAELRSYPE